MFRENKRKKIKGGNIMENLMIFKNQEFGEIRILGVDITTKLGYKNGSRDINRHTDEEDRAEVPIRYFRSK